MDIMEFGTRKACAACWGVCGFASSRQKLEMARSKQGLTSILQRKDLIAGSAQCRMCNYLVDELKWQSETASLDPKIAMNVRFQKFNDKSLSPRYVDSLEIRTEQYPWTEARTGTRWSVLAHRGS
jgi:hypothetical protein